mmetsp:Transcript_19017/g.55311  ORF Transcript_19017/g.55311 Transcript_19017/m.55311 type:complete len:225 (-) Transcript_19017:677-1351(-)
MYFKETGDRRGFGWSLKWSAILCLSQEPTSLNRTLPDASVAPTVRSFASRWTAACPDPSATTRRTWPSARSLSSRKLSNPPSPSSSKSISGIKTQSTSRLPKVECRAINPEFRPMSWTMPIPFGKLLASTCAAVMASWASATAVSKPNDLSIMGMSLSTVFGTPATAMGNLRRVHSSATFCAPRRVPSPPMMNTRFTPFSSRASTIFSVSCPPRDVPRTVPPRV